MPIIATASESKSYAPAPQGTHQAVCVDVIDIGMKPNPFKDGALQHKVDLAWQIDEHREDGKRFIVYKRYTLSLNEKATLRHDLESWRGRPFSDHELRGFDVETIIGANCLINVQHKAGSKDPNKVFANVVAVMPLAKGMPKLAPLDYERQSAEQQPHVEDAPAEVPVEEEVYADDIPF